MNLWYAGWYSVPFQSTNAGLVAASVGNARGGTSPNSVSWIDLNQFVCDDYKMKTTYGAPGKLCDPNTGAFVAPISIRFAQAGTILAVLFSIGTWLPAAIMPIDLNYKRYARVGLLFALTAFSFGLVPVIVFSTSVIPNRALTSTPVFVPFWNISSDGSRIMDVTVSSDLEPLRFAYAFYCIVFAVIFSGVAVLVFVHRMVRTVVLSTATRPVQAIPVVEFADAVEVDAASMVLNGSIPVVRAVEVVDSEAAVARRSRI